MKKLFMIFGISVVLVACNGGSSSTETTEDSTDVAMDSTPISRDSDSMQLTKDSELIIHEEHDDINRNPASVDTSYENPKPKGYAIVYCPTKMITHVPCIVDATITKDDIAKAIVSFRNKVKLQNPKIQESTIDRDIKGDSIDIYENMGIELEFDSDDFKQISKNTNQPLDFKNKKSLEWEWIIKPMHSTEKSILNFKFYYSNPDNTREYILEKTIRIFVTVDARTFLDKWKDFLVDDPKTTITVILVPLISFFGGLLFGKKSSK